MKKFIRFFYKKYQLDDYFYSKKEIISIIETQERFLNENVLKEEKVNITEHFLKSKDKGKILRFIDYLQDLIFSYEFYESIAYEDYSLDLRILDQDPFITETEKENMCSKIEKLISTSEKKLKETENEIKNVLNGLSIVR